MKQIKTDAKVNQVQTTKLIASLIAEKEKLLRDLEAANRSGTPADGLTYDGDCLFYCQHEAFGGIYEIHCASICCVRNSCG